MVDAKTMQIIPQDPNDSNSVTLFDRIMKQEGIEFTYSVWLFIDDLVYQQGQYNMYSIKAMIILIITNNHWYESTNNAPGLYIAP